MPSHKRRSGGSPSSKNASTSSSKASEPTKAAASNEQMQDLIQQEPEMDANYLAHLMNEEAEVSGPTPGEHRFPWGGGVYVHSDGEVLYMPSSNEAGNTLEQIGFEWYGESGYLALPKDSGGGLIDGTYALPSGGALIVVGGEVLVELPSYDHETSMETGGFSWAGESGYMGLP